ncbi:MspA family porin [Williamsia serinedens]|uniref:MspA protein n=1 Tax=Williamsia serinedens TaxID=391736 RepID=A0ABT1H076_9NOCA|nr:MspA family porin [Williamsia serinedens]MCP2160601.1 MspA protein [Williamsia serinedens]
MKNSTKRRVGAAAGIAAVSAVALSSMGAGGAAAGPLPGGFTTQTLADGTKVSVQLKDEFVTIARSGAANATTRNAWVSGKVIVTVNGAQASGGDVTAGYLVGCQVDFSGGGSVGSGGALAFDNGGIAAGDTNVTPNGSVTLAPGVAKFIPVLDSGVGKYNGSDSSDTSFSFKGNRGGIAYSQETFQVNGCAGYASAKAAISVKVSTDAVDGYVTLYGRPFSIG